MRVVTVKPHEDGGIEGKYIEYPTVTIMEKIERSGFERLLGKEANDHIVHSSICDVEYDVSMFEPIHEILKLIPWGETSTIKPDFKERVYTSYYGKGTTKKSYTTYGSSKSYWDEYDDFYSTYYPPLDNKKPTSMEVKEFMSTMNQETKNVMEQLGYNPADPADVEDYMKWQQDFAY
jgi:hypothetical protein